MPEIKISYEMLDIIDALSEILGIQGQSYPARLHKILLIIQSNLSHIKKALELLLDLLNSQDFEKIRDMEQRKQQILALYHHLF